MRQIEDNNSPFQRAVMEGLIDSSGNSIKPKKRGPKPENMGDWAPVFLAALQCGATVRKAARQAGVHPTMPFKRRGIDPEFSRSWNQAADIGTRLLEQEAQRRAYHGTIKPVFYKGMKCGYVNEYSDLMMIFLLKARRPDKYREGVEDGVQGGTVVNIQVTEKPDITNSEPKPIPAIEVVTVGECGQQNGRSLQETTPVS